MVKKRTVPSFTPPSAPPHISDFILMNILENVLGHFPMPCRMCESQYGYCKEGDGSEVSSLSQNGCQLFVTPLLVLGRGVTVLTLGGDWQEVVTLTRASGSTDSRAAEAWPAPGSLVSAVPTADSAFQLLCFWLLKCHSYWPFSLCCSTAFSSLELHNLNIFDLVRLCRRDCKFQITLYSRGRRLGEIVAWMDGLGL